MEKRVSADDASVNWISPFGAGSLEARFVRRCQEYFIAYLSSHSGCDRACRMCHLTATRQTSFEPASIEDFLRQAREVFAHYDQDPVPAARVNFNWMARGEPLLNPSLTGEWGVLSDALLDMAKRRGLAANLNISSIMPLEFDRELSDVFTGPIQPRIYYSLYSADEAFRKRWLPKAQNVAKALDNLVRWQRIRGGEVVLHWAFIDGENDSDATIDAILRAVAQSGLRYRFNAVRYNPFESRHGVEAAPEKLNRAFESLARAADIPGSRIVPRVGFDVKASCGMFVQGEKCA